jgi:hypothetical protein
VVVLHGDGSLQDGPPYEDAQQPLDPAVGTRLDVALASERFTVHHNHSAIRPLDFTVGEIRHRHQEPHIIATQEALAQQAVLTCHPRRRIGVMRLSAKLFVIRLMGLVILVNISCCR